ncbi:MAG TPA: helix-turn-helix transcriptional regulator [Streptosporangiaceae bacterium]|nr:helix-turn-helix transcriptional regulator [Streptosporangiaceae bacterium]
MTGASPTVRQRELGMRLRQLRNARSLTVEEVAAKLLCSATKISRVETGARRPTLRDVRDLCSIYGVSESGTAELMELARKAREQGWWNQYDDLDLTPYIGLEQAATSITCFTMYYIPALMQTGDYAQAIIMGIAPKIDPRVHEQRVEARLRRQQRLERDDRPRYRVILDEAVLHRQVGGAAVMAAQLDKVLRFERDGKATIQVIPFNVGAHAGQDSNFVLLEFDDPEPLPAVVFVESLTNQLYQERKTDVDRYREAVEYLRDAALTPRDSVLRIAEAQKAYADEA